MATDYFSFTFAIQPPETPLKNISFDNITHLCNEAYNNGVFLMSSSRNNWILGVMEQLISLYPVRNLSFLTQLGAWLNTEQIYSSIQDLKYLLHAFELEPKKILDIIDHGNTQDELLDAIRHTVASTNPSFGNDGDDVNYLISYIKSQVAILEDALLKNSHVIYVQHEHL